MDERSLILNAIKQKKTVQEVDLNIDTPEPDAIEKWVKKKRLQDSFRHKTCEDWNSADFLRYLDSMLKDFGVKRAKGNLRIDSNNLNRVHDRLADRLQEKMNNTVLKNYLDWYCSIWAPRLTGSEMYLTALLQDYLIKRFVTRYSEEESHKEILPQTPITVNDDSIYELGGLDLLVMQRGIVVGFRMLRHRAIPDPAHTMRTTLSHLTKDTLTEVMNTTIQQSPYPNSDKVDFLVLAQPYLQVHGLSKMYDSSYECHFREC